MTTFEDTRQTQPGPTKEERIIILKQEFAQMPSNRWTNLTQADLYTYLDEKGKKQYDREVGDQIWERMIKNEQGESTVEEFIKVFMEAEDILQAKINQAMNYLQNYHVQKDEAVSKLENLRRTESLNVYGVMSDSTLTVIVTELHNLRINEITNCCYAVVYLECEDQKFHTGDQPPNTPDPVLNQSFIL